MVAELRGLIMKQDSEINKLIEKVNAMKKENKLDLSSDEDLSIALMNLISIEEHMYFSGMKTGKKKYFEMLDDVREMRKKYMKEIVKNPEAQSEEWCISKHLLASSMRLIEVGNKHLTKKEDTKAQEKFEDAFHLYSIFWGINLKLMKNEELAKPQESKAWKDKVGAAVKKIIDCCKE